MALLKCSTLEMSIAENRKKLIVQEGRYIFWERGGMFYIWAGHKKKSPPSSANKSASPNSTPQSDP